MKELKNIKNIKNDILLKIVLNIINEEKKIDKNKLYFLVHDYIRRAAKKNNLNDKNFLDSLEKEWYHSIRVQNIPDYSIYADDRYIADALYCYFGYSKKYILSIIKQTNYIDKYDYSSIMQCKTIIDLGAGYGITSILLSQLFPNAKVISTNIKDTLQWQIMKKLAKAYSFEITDNFSKLKNADIVFASEYFEHFKQPIIHLRKVITEISPKYLIFANAFNADAVGHFDMYQIHGINIKCNKVGHIFNTTLRGLGYKKVHTKMWNNRPSIYMKDITKKSIFD